jgi:uncharacterized protein YndB with AHSA1/START domain
MARRHSVAFGRVGVELNPARVPLAVQRTHNRSMKGDPNGLALHLETVLQAPRERVFGACVEPEQLAKWWGPTGFTVLRVETSVRVGGRYRLTMQPPAGQAFHLSGEFREVEPPRRLAYTFEYEEPDPDDQETLVTLSFLDDGEGTSLILDQGPFATEARLALHHTGWTETFERLEEFLA